MNKTSISWTDFTSNPIRYQDAAGKMVWACERVSPGCANCYAADLAVRYGRGGGKFTEEERKGYSVYLDESETHHMRNARVIAGKPVKGSRVFLGDMTDIFGEWVPDDLLNRLFSNVLEMRTDVTWQILTKRAKRMHDYLAWRWGDGRIPSRHIHVGVSVENQHFADERIPLLLKTPAAVRFLSLEPLLSAVDLTQIPIPNSGRGEEYDPIITMNVLRRASVFAPHIDWAIVGGESGPDVRDPGVQAIVDTVQQLVYAGVPVFVKQDVGPRPGEQGRIPDVVWAFKQFPAVPA